MNVLPLPSVAALGALAAALLTAAGQEIFPVDTASQPEIRLREERLKARWIKQPTLRARLDKSRESNYSICIPTVWYVSWRGPTLSDSNEKILKIGLSLFLQKSYKEVSIQEIVDKVGLTKGAFYYFFKSKEQFFQEIFRGFFLSELKTDYTQFSHDSLYRFYHDYLGFGTNRKPSTSKNGGLMKNGPSVNTYAFIMDALKHFPQLRSEAKEVQLAEQKCWEKIVRRARSQGEIRSPMNDEQIASIFIFISDGFGMRSLMMGRFEGFKGRLLALWDGFYAELKA